MSKSIDDIKGRIADAVLNTIERKLGGDKDADLAVGVLVTALARIGAWAECASTDMRLADLCVTIGADLFAAIRDERNALIAEGHLEIAA